MRKEEVRNSAAECEIYPLPARILIEEAFFSLQLEERLVLATAVRCEKVNPPTDFLSIGKESLELEPPR